MRNESDIWFAWHPVPLGAIGNSRWAWLQKVWRNRCMGVTIYQSLKDFPHLAKDN